MTNIIKNKKVAKNLKKCYHNYHLKKSFKASCFENMGMSMNTSELFIDGYQLPKPLSKQEVYDLLDKIKQGDEKAIERLASHNIRLVLLEVTGKFSTVEYDKKDLVSIGNVGLMKAITTFDTSKNVEFSTYAMRCIDNEILQFLRKFKKYANDESLDRTISQDKNGNELKIGDILSDDTDILEEYTDNELHRIIREVVKNLPDRDRKIIILHFGFYNNETHTQKEISKMLSISQPCVSRIISRIVKQVGEILEENGLIELRAKNKPNRISNHNTIKEEKDKKMARELQTIYQYFKDYTKEQVDEMLEKLSEEEKSLITIRYGEDLNNPLSEKLNKEQYAKFYGSLVPKMKRLLANPKKERKPRKSKEKESEIVTHNLVNTEIEPVRRNATQQTTKPSEPIKGQDIKEKASETNVEFMTKDDCLKILELLRTPSFSQMMSTLSVKESVIISLKLGYVDGKYFSTDSIAEFLGIEPQEVIDTTRKVLLLYRENINQFIDNAIQIVTEGEKISSPVVKTFHK